MITPTTITNYNRTEEELEEFLMFAILVAGKGAEQQAKKLEEFLWNGSGRSPFDYIQWLNDKNQLMDCMKACKLGQYKRITSAFKGILKFKDNLKNVTIDELEGVKGIGSKTARFFILHSRPNQQLAVLDTHILKWLAKATRIGMPKSTPPKSKYKTIESLFLTEASIRNMSPADLDLQIWKEYATKTK
jgi:thermostable 8-oxoguanine DNA glycosylase